MAVVSRDKTNPTTINELRQYYDLEQISKTKKAVSTQGETITQINSEQTNILNSIIMNMTGLESQTDMSLWFFSEVPTLLNSPALDWTTVELKDDHLGDLYFNRETGYTYKFIITDTVYSWEQVLDNEIIQAMALTNAEIDIIDNQRKVFFTTPTVPYSNGDWWLKEEGLYICQVSRIEGQTFKETDFIIGTKYVVGTQATEINNKLTVTNGRVATVEVGLEAIEQRIEEVVDITDYITTVTGNNTITLNNTFASDCVVSYVKFSNLVDNSTIYPSSILFPSANIFPSEVLNYNLRIYNNGVTEEQIYNIPASGLLNYDDYVEIINGDVYITQNGITTKLEDKIYIRTYDNTTTIRMELGANVLGDKIDVTYLRKNNLSDVFSPRIEKEASIKIATDEINLEVSKKVGQDEVRSRINLSTEGVKIEGKNIDITGTASFNNNVIIEEDGTLNAKNGIFQGDVTADNLFLNSGGKVISGDGLLTNLQYTSSRKQLGQSMYSYEGVFIQRSAIDFDVYIPANFVVESAFITVYVLKTKNSFIYNIENVKENYGKVQNIRLYKNTMDQEIFNSWLGTFNFSQSLVEIPGAFGENGFTASTIEKSQFNSIDIKDSLIQGETTNLTLRTADEPLNIEIEADVVKATQQTQIGYAIANIIGYMSYE
jgi:hypothetical protein